MTERHQKTLAEVARELADGSLSSVELVDACLARADATADNGAYLHLAHESARKAAQQSDARRQAGRALGPLDGVAVGVKDIFVTRDMPTTCASKILQGFVSPYDATVVRKLHQAGAVVLGKLNMDEFGMGSSNEHSAYKLVRNPWDPERVPGGSSGGCSSALADGSAVACIGTDTGGSIRQPAAHTGTVGLKPTYGRVSRYGALAYASSFDHVGPMTKDVRDAAMLLQLLAGHDPRDATSSQREVPDYVAALSGGVRGLRIGVPKEYFAVRGDAEVTTAVEGALRTYEKLGAKLVEVSLPHTGHGIATYYVLAPAEASSNLARYDGVRYGKRDHASEGLLDMYTHSRSQGFGTEVKRRIMLGTWVLSAKQRDAYYTQAQRNRTLVRRDFDAAFQEVDVLATPTAPSPAFRIGERENDPMKMYLGDVYTVPANLAGLPGISLPCGFTAKGLPVGLQLLSAPFTEALLLRAAYAYEQAHDWHLRRAG